MTHLWCILVLFGAYFTVSGIPCFQCSKTKSRLHTTILTVVTPQRCGDGVSVVYEMTVPHRVEFI